MAITIYTTPARISNSAAFNVYTSLVEDATHVNLRIRANIYHEGYVKAIVERPKGISDVAQDFDFSEILKSFIPGLLATNIRQVDLGAGVMAYKIDTEDANLITGWSSHSGTWTTLTTSGSDITEAVCTVLSELKTNDIALTRGQCYLFTATTFDSIHTTPLVYLESSMGAAAEAIQDGKSILIMPTYDMTVKLLIGGTTNEDFSGYFSLNKITTSKTTVGSLVAPYFISFDEVYEDASGVTWTVAAAAKTVLLRYINAKGDGTAFTEYVMHDNACLFANKTFRNNITKFYTKVPLECNLVLFTEYQILKLYYSKNGGAYSDIYVVAQQGYAVVPLSTVELMSGVTSNIRLYMVAQTASGEVTISEVLTVNIDSSTIDERTVLEFDGLVGGKEYLAFEGLKDEQFSTVRSYRAGANKNRLPLSFAGIVRQKLETRFNDINNTEYLKSLLISETVKKLNASAALPTDVTIITDTVSINKGRELFTNQIDIEYEY